MSMYEYLCIINIIYVLSYTYILILNAKNKLKHIFEVVSTHSIRWFF